MRGIWQCTRGCRPRRRGRRGVRRGVRPGDDRVRGRRRARRRAGRRVRARGGRAHRVDDPRDAAQDLPDHHASCGRTPCPRVRRRAHRPVLARPAGAPPPAPPPAGDATCDLAIVGGGFTGLWAAILAKQDDPGRDVVLLEGDTVAFGGSGRNGGFVDASLTHGLPNGLARFPDEIDELERLGAREPGGHRGDARALRHRRRLRDATAWSSSPASRHEVGGAVRRRGRDAGVRRSTRSTSTGRRCGASSTRRRTSAGSGSAPGNAIVDPARLALGPGRGGAELGVRVHEHTPVTGTARDAGRRRADGRRGRRCVRAASCSPPTASRRWCGRSAATWCRSTTTCWSPSRSRPSRRPRSGGATGRASATAANQFHYYRLTRGRPHPVGRLRRRLPLRQRGRAAARACATRRTRCWPITSSRRSRSSTGVRSPTAGRA